MLITNDTNLAEKAKYYRDHGRNGLECEIWAETQGLTILCRFFELSIQRALKRRLKSEKTLPICISRN